MAPSEINKSTIYVTPYTVKKTIQNLAKLPHHKKEVISFNIVFTRVTNNLNAHKLASFKAFTTRLLKFSLKEKSYVIINHIAQIMYLKIIDATIQTKHKKERIILTLSTLPTERLDGWVEVVGLMLFLVGSSITYWQVCMLRLSSAACFHWQVLYCVLL